MGEPLEWGREEAESQGHRQWQVALGRKEGAPARPRLGRSQILENLGSGEGAWLLQVNGTGSPRSREEERSQID